MDTSKILPDSRAREAKNIKHSSYRIPMNWVPIFCANCGIPYGYVPEENCTFACWLCDPCSTKYGVQFGALMMPDEVYWQKIAEEQLERYKRVLTPEEFQMVSQETWGALAKLKKESPLRHQLK